MDFHLENFDGPLDLLLHLIAKNKVSIYDIPIAVILDQYMEVLHAAEAMDLDIAGDSWRWRRSLFTSSRRCCCRAMRRTRRTIPVPDWLRCCWNTSA